MYLSFLQSFYGLITNFILVLNNITFSGFTSLLIHSPTEDVLVDSKFWQLWKKLLLWSCADFYMDISFHLHCVNTNTHIHIIFKLYDNNVLCFVINHQTVFHDYYCILHSDRNKWVVPVAPHTCQHLVSSVFWILTVIKSMWYYCIAILIYISLMIWCRMSFHILACHLYIFLYEVSLNILALGIFSLFYFVFILTYMCLHVVCVFPPSHLPPTHFWVELVLSFHSPILLKREHRR
jgi:hypothetical protein